MAKYKFSKITESSLFKLTDHKVISWLIIAAIAALPVIVITFWNWVKIILTRQILGWHLLLSLGLAVLAAYIYNRSRKPKRIPVPFFYDYKSAHLYNILWKWQWGFMDNEVFHPIEITAYCEICEIRIVNLTCPKCGNKPFTSLTHMFGNSYPEASAIENVVAIIEKDIDSEFSLKGAMSREIDKKRDLELFIEENLYNGEFEYP